MRSFTSPVERTSISSRCGSGHLSISVSSMCMANSAPDNRAPCAVSRAPEDVSRTELHPRQLPSFNSHLPEDALAVDLDTEDIRPGRDVCPRCRDRRQARLQAGESRSWEADVGGVPSATRLPAHGSPRTAL